MENIIDLAEKYHELQEKEDAFFDEANKTEIKQEKDVIIKQAVTLSLENNKDDLKSFKIALWSSWSALEKIQKEKKYIFNQTFSTTKDGFDNWEQKFIAEPKKKFNLQDKDQIIEKLQEISKKYAGKKLSTMSRQKQLEMCYDISQCFSKEPTLTFKDYKKAIDYATFFSLVFVSTAENFSTEVDVFYSQAGLKPHSVVWAIEVGTVASQIIFYFICHFWYKFLLFLAKYVEYVAKNN